MLEVAAPFVASISALASVIQAVKVAKEIKDDDVQQAEEILTHPNPSIGRINILFLNI